MRRPRPDETTLSLGLILIFLLAVTTTAHAQDPYRLKPGARGPLCLGCHSDIQDQMEMSSVHTPVESGECSDCHNPHASSHGQLLASDPAGICAGCHADTVPPEPLSVHAALSEGGCASCHDPHASDNPNNLMAAGNELCFACHSDIQAEVEGNEFQHPPVVDDCLACHDPHASESSASLLKAAVGDLCAECHDPERPSFRERHQGYPVAGSDCTSCHDPHGSRHSGILLAQVHEPVANRMCSQCHQDAGSGAPLETRRPGVLLCAGCHNDLVNEAHNRDHVHWPVVEGKACLSCHAPHASEESTLLVEAQDRLCTSCHPDAIASPETTASTHPPVEAGECSACHEPHAAEFPSLLRAATGMDLCGTCHDWQSHSSHPIGAEVTDPRNPNLIVDCSSCHRPHDSPFQGLTHKDPGGDLCVQCHQQMNR